MGRANIYLSEDLERRVRAAKLAVSEICQQALLAAVEAAESAPAPFGPTVAEGFASGWTAGAEWAAGAEADILLRLLRDAHLPEIPREQLPASWFSWNDQQTLAWEAGFVEAARSTVRAVMVRDLSIPTVPARSPAVPDESPAADSPGPESAAGDEDDVAPAEAGSIGLDKPTAEGESTPLGDGSGSFIGTDRDGRRVAFDPHAALEADKSPLFAVLGPADQRARLTLSIGQDAAARGAAVVVVDVSGALAPRARGLGRNVRVVRANPSPLPAIDDLMRGGGNLRGIWEAMAGLAAGGGGLFPGTGGSEDVVKPGYVTVLSLAGDGAIAGIMSAAQALKTLAGLTSVTDHPRLLQVDLPTGVTVPAAVASLLTRQIRTAREHDVAFGLSAESAETVTGIGGSGALLSTVFGFATTSPVEADRLRDLLGAHAPVLLSPPGASTRPGDEAWCVMRDLEGRLGQVRIDGA
jgi:hypothetical protein